MAEGSSYCTSDWSDLPQFKSPDFGLGSWALRHCFSFAVNYYLEGAQVNFAEGIESGILASGIKVNGKKKFSPTL